MTEHLERTQRRQRQRSIALSYYLVQEIKRSTKGAISVSSFIRMAIVRELERQNKNAPDS